MLFRSIITFITFWLLYKTNLEKYNRKVSKVKKENTLKSIVSKLKIDKVSRFYLLYVFFGEIAFSCITEMQVLLLAEYFLFSETVISNYSILLGIGSVLIGAIAMAKITFKNNYINILIKYGTRLFLYLVAFFSNQKIFMLIAFVYVELSSDMYIDITDGAYVNRYSNEEQLPFNNLKEMIEYIGTGIGVLLCGFALLYKINYIFLVGSFFITIQIGFAFYSLYLKNQEQKIDKIKK